MARPRTKQEILEAIELERLTLTDTIAKLNDEQMEMPGACEKWSVKDILSHLTDWEQRCLRWHRAGLRGEVPKTPDEHYTWRQLPALNQEIYEKYKDRSLGDVQQAFEESFAEMMAALDQMSEEELFYPGYYVWTGKGLLRDFVNANTVSHYRWATRLIRKFVRGLEKEPMELS